MENYIWKTRIITLAQYIEEIGYGTNFEQAVKMLLEDFGVVAEYYAYTTMFDKHYGDFVGRCFCPITNGHTEAFMYTINTLLDEHH